MDHKFKIFDHHKKFAEFNTKCLSGNDNNLENAVKIDAFLNKILNIYIIQSKTKDSRKDKVTKRSQRATVSLPIAKK